jgi:DNA-binding MltR family transcriptional regulator
MARERAKSRPPKPKDIPPNPRHKAAEASKKNGKPRISRRWPDSEQTSVLIDQISHTQPAMVVAILGATLLEYDIDQLLRAKLKHRDDETWTRLTGEKGAISSFSSKTELAYALGIIDAELKKNIDLVRRIRNDFAHSRIVIDFDTPEISAELRRITLPKKRRTPLYKSLHEIVRALASRQEPLPPSVAYAWLCLGLSNFLARKMLSVGNAKISALNRRARNKEIKGLSPLAAALMRSVPPEQWPTDSPQALLAQQIVNPTPLIPSRTPTSSGLGFDYQVDPSRRPILSGFDVEVPDVFQPKVKK